MLLFVCDIRVTSPHPGNDLELKKIIKIVVKHISYMSNQNTKGKRSRMMGTIIMCVHMWCHLWLPVTLLVCWWILTIFFVHMPSQLNLSQLLVLHHSLVVVTSVANAALLLMLDVSVGAYQSSLGRYVCHDDVHAASVHQAS